MVQRGSCRRSVRPGLTLMELIVVLLILTAIAAISIPLFTRFVQRTHGASGSSNIREITNAITRYELEKFKAPDHWDSLLDGAGGTIAASIPNGGGELTKITLTAEQRARLVDAGITTLHNLNAAAENKTFAPYDGATVDLTTGTPDVASASAVAVNRELGAPLTGTYVAFGLGAKSKLINATMVDAPVHFLEGKSPIDEYARFIAIYQVGDSAGFEGPARFTGVVAVDAGGLRGLGAHLQEYYESVE